MTSSPTDDEELRLNLLKLTKKRLAAYARQAGLCRRGRPNKQTIVADLLAFQARPSLLLLIAPPVGEQEGI